MSKILTLPDSASTDLLASTGELFADLWILFAILMGIPLGYFMITLMIDLFKQEFERYKTRQKR